MIETHRLYRRTFDITAPVDVEEALIWQEIDFCTWQPGTTRELPCGATVTCTRVTPDADTEGQADGQ